LQGHRLVGRVFGWNQVRGRLRWGISCRFDHADDAGHRTGPMKHAIVREVPLVTEREAEHFSRRERAGIKKAFLGSDRMLGAVVLSPRHGVARIDGQSLGNERRVFDADEVGRGLSWKAQG